MSERTYPVEKIHDLPHSEGSEGLLATIIRAEECREGIKFYTDEREPLQVGVMSYEAGKFIPPHRHKTRRTLGEGTQEVLIVKRGLVVVTIYTSEGYPIATRSLQPGDILIQFRGGHRFEMRPGSAMVEVKSGPYLGNEDKVPLEVQ